MDTDVFQKDVEEEYSLRPPTATKILKDMEKNGLIRRETVPYDARLKRIVVTEKGLQYQGMIRESLEETERRLTAGITEDDLATFFRVISRMIRNMS
jgi:transcriptional regulator